MLPLVSLPLAIDAKAPLRSCLVHISILSLSSRQPLMAHVHHVWTRETIHVPLSRIYLLCPSQRQLRVWQAHHKHIVYFSLMFQLPLSSCPFLCQTFPYPRMSYHYKLGTDSPTHPNVFAPVHVMKLAI